MNAALFIDANRYLNFYEIASGKALLDSLDEQKDHIFVSAQIVDEVLRRKFDVAQAFLEKLKEIDATKTPAPDHLLGITDEKIAEFKGIIRQAADVRNQLARYAASALSRIIESEDDVSKRLAALFEMASRASADQMQRARERKECGNPPGKRSDPLGDQIIWEQLLDHCKCGGITRLWMITADRDYYIKHRNQLLLHPLLRRDLVEACGDTLEVHCFDDLLKGITHFGRNAGVTAERLPTEEQAAEIERDLETLKKDQRQEVPLIAWTTSFDDGVYAATEQERIRRRHPAATTSSYGLPFDQAGPGSIGTGSAPSADTGPAEK